MTPVGWGVLWTLGAAACALSFAGVVWLAALAWLAVGALLLGLWFNLQR